jgi:sugar phosphate permease
MSAWFSREEMGLAMGIWSTTLPLSGLCIFVLGSLMIAAQGWTSVLWITFL